MQSNNMCDYCKKRDDRPYCYEDCDVAFSDENKIVGELNCEFEGMEVECIRHGKWIKLDKPKWFRCSECDNSCYNDFETRLYEYCPHCGTRMDGDE